MRHQLGAVHADQCTMTMRQLRDLMNRRHPAGDVGRSGDRHEFHFLGTKDLFEGRHVETHFAVQTDAHDFTASPMRKVV